MVSGTKMLIGGAVGAGVVWWWTTQRGPANGGNTARCQDQIEAAQAHAEGLGCTAEVRTLQCPHDPSVTYQARNGCEVSYLTERGWTEPTASPDATDRAFKTASIE